MVIQINHYFQHLSTINLMYYKNYLSYLMSIFALGISSRSGADSSDSNENELELESPLLVIQKEPKSGSNSDSKAGITAALVSVSGIGQR